MPFSEVQPWRNVLVTGELSAHQEMEQGMGTQDGHPSPPWHPLPAHRCAGILHEPWGTGDNSSTVLPFKALLLKQNRATGLLLPLCFSLCRKRALCECFRGSASCRLPSLLQVHKVAEYLAGAWFAFPETLVVFISWSAVPPFPAEAQKGFLTCLEWQMPPLNRSL